jgi:hypothetical protein
VCRPPVAIPSIRCRPHDAALGRDHEAGRIRVERVGDELLVGAGAIGVGGVDEVHAERHGTLQQAQCRGTVGRVAPDAGPCEAHGTESDATHPQVADGHGVVHGRAPLNRGPRLRRLT